MNQRTTTPKSWCCHTFRYASIQTTVVHQEFAPQAKQHNLGNHLRSKLILTNPATQILATRRRHVSMLLHITCSNRFSFSSFKHSLTLFSKFFSSFPHGTCSLSVSRKYLALEEIYLPLCTSSPRSTTLWRYALCSELHATDGILTLSDALFQGT